MFEYLFRFEYSLSAVRYQRKQVVYFLQTVASIDDKRDNKDSYESSTNKERKARKSPN